MCNMSIELQSKVALALFSNYYKIAENRVENNIIFWDTETATENRSLSI